MKIYNKFVESKKEPLNKNDIWFDGSVFKIYKDGEWRTITLTKEAIDRIIEYAKSVDIYVMVKELPEFGEKGKIYVLQTIVGDSIELSEHVWENDSWKLVGNFNSVSLVLDNELSETSHNAVANHVITEALNTKVNKSELATPDWNAQKGEDGYIKNKTHFFEWHAKPEDENFNDLLLGLKDKTPISVTKDGHIKTVKYLANECSPMCEQDFEYFDSSWEANYYDILDGFITVPDIFGGTASPKISVSRDYDDDDNELIHVTIQWYTDYTTDDVNIIIDQICSDYYIIPYHNYDILELNDKYISSNIARTAYVASKQQLTELSTETETIRIEVESHNELIEDLQNTKIDKEADDYYPQLSVGLADNLSGVDVVDSEVNFRRSGGGAISDGVARIEAIKGNSVVWNQRVKPFQEVDIKPSISGITFHGNDITIVNWEEHRPFRFNVQLSKTIGHKYLLLLDYANPNADQKVLLQFGGGTAAAYSAGHCVMFYTNSTVTTGVYADYLSLYLNTTMEGSITLSDLNLYDLTQMFGAGNEPTTIEEFYARIPMGVDLNAYNEGEVIHMDVQSIESQGVNAWDGELERGQITNGEDAPSSIMARSIGYMNIIPNAEYYATCKYYVYVHFYDRNKNFISKTNAVTTFRTPSNAHYLRFSLYLSGGTVELDTQVCINLSDTSINGKYFPYVKRVEDLSIIRKYFPQGMKSAGTAHDEIRYNKATQKWEYSKGKMKEVKMKDLNWSYNSSTIFSARISDMYIAKNNDERKDGILSAKYGISEIPNISTEMSDKSLLRASQIYLRDTSYSDVASLKASFTDDDILYYESNDWEWVELDADDQFKDLDYQVWNCGTEKAIAEGKSAPLAADITYGFNAIGQIKELRAMVEAMQAKLANMQ